MMTHPISPEMFFSMLFPVFSGFKRDNLVDELNRLIYATPTGEILYVNSRI
jgi:hypothetical protein